MAQTKKKIIADNTLPFGRTNLMILLAAMAMLVLGFIFMAQPPVDSFLSLTAAPIILLIAFLLVIPYAIMYGHKKKNDTVE